MPIERIITGGQTGADQGALRGKPRAEVKILDDRFDRREAVVPDACQGLIDPDAS